MHNLATALRLCVEYDAYLNRMNAADSPFWRKSFLFFR